MAKTKTVYVCANCGEESITWQGKCPVCGAWNTFKPLVVASKPASDVSSSTVTIEPLSLTTYEARLARVTTGFSEFDRVLGGGLVPGSVILLGGEPGIGKSTLLLQVAHQIAQNKPVIYFSGEESSTQVASRAKRLNVEPGFLFANETRLPVIRQLLLTHKPTLAIIDSIQTLYDETFPSTPGSLVQVRECALQLQEVAKQNGISLIIVGHITKEGTVAGPKTLEHMVDVVLYLEGEPRSGMRVLRGIKNRFGATYEVGLFELHDTGLVSVGDATHMFIEQHAQEVHGSALTAVLEGARPILVEIQALTVQTSFGYPKRTSSGVDLQRLHILLAILESHTSTSFASSDVFLNVVGGYKIQDRAADLAICMAILSSWSTTVIPTKQVFYGEVGLTGEIRQIPQHDRIAREVKRLGYLPMLPYKSVKEMASALALHKHRKGMHNVS